VILLDTCAIIWDALDTSKLSPAAKSAIECNEQELIICDISIWEIAMLVKKRRLVLDSTASEFVNLLLQARHYLVQEITPEIAELSVNLESGISGDPADRLIAATSILGNAPVVTADNHLRTSDIVKTIW